MLTRRIELRVTILANSGARNYLRECYGREFIHVHESFTCNGLREMIDPGLCKCDWWRKGFIQKLSTGISGHIMLSNSTAREGNSRTYLQTEVPSDYDRPRICF